MNKISTRLKNFVVIIIHYSRRTKKLINKNFVLLNADILLFNSDKYISYMFIIFTRFSQGSEDNIFCFSSRFIVHVLFPPNTDLEIIVNRDQNANTDTTMLMASKAKLDFGVPKMFSFNK